MSSRLIFAGGPGAGRCCRCCAPDVGADCVAEGTGVCDGCNAGCCDCACRRLQPEMQSKNTRTEIAANATPLRGENDCFMESVYAKTKAQNRCSALRCGCLRENKQSATHR